jgi:hypothetical protein
MHHSSPQFQRRSHDECCRVVCTCQTTFFLETVLWHLLLHSCMASLASAAASSVVASPPITPPPAAVQPAETPVQTPCIEEAPAAAQPPAAEGSIDAWHARLKAAVTRSRELFSKPAAAAAAPSQEPASATPAAGVSLAPGERLICTCDEDSSFEEERIKWEEQRERGGAAAGGQTPLPSNAARQDVEKMMRLLLSEAEATQLEGLLQLSQLISSLGPQLHILRSPDIIVRLHQLLSAHNNPELQVRPVGDSR